MKSLSKAIVASLTLFAAGWLIYADNPKHDDEAVAIVRLNFQKCKVDDRGAEHAGAVTGAFEGELRTKIMNFDAIEKTEPLWPLKVRYSVDAGPYSFVARLEGVSDNSIGKAVLTGRIVKGWNKGARVLIRQDYLLESGAALCFAGHAYIVREHEE